MRRLWLYGVPLLLLQGLSACSGAPEQNNAARNTDAGVNVPPAAEAASADGPLIVAFGDSLYAGYQLPQGEGLAPELERVLRAEGVPATVFGAGVSGDTTAAGRQRLAFVLDGLARKPDLVIIGLGGNDLLRGLPVEETRANMDAMLALLRERGIPAMLTGMRAPLNMGSEYVSAFDSLYPELARQYGATLHPFLLDGVITNPALLLADGIHPNAEGVDRMARAIAPAVIGALPASASDPNERAGNSPQEQG
jgi:acyl-CoA thioesterase I